MFVCVCDSTDVLGVREQLRSCDGLPEYYREGQSGRGGVPDSVRKATPLSRTEAQGFPYSAGAGARVHVSCITYCVCIVCSCGGITI